MLVNSIYLSSYFSSSHETSLMDRNYQSNHHCSPNKFVKVIDKYSLLLDDNAFLISASLSEIFHVKHA